MTIKRLEDLPPVSIEPSTASMFRKRFSADCTCVIAVAMPLVDGDKHIIGIEWRGNRTNRMLRPYIAWVNSVNQKLAGEWNKTLCHIFQMDEKSKAQLWIYEPGKPPRKAEKFTILD